MAALVRDVDLDLAQPGVDQGGEPGGRGLTREEGLGGHDQSSARAQELGLDVTVAIVGGDQPPHLRSTVDRRLLLQCMLGAAGRTLQRGLKFSAQGVMRPQSGQAGAEDGVDRQHERDGQQDARAQRHVPS